MLILELFGVGGAVPLKDIALIQSNLKSVSICSYY